MDKMTVDIYSNNAQEFSKEWSSQESPEDMYSIFNQFLIKNGKTVDIGCGSGRDVFWLNENGFPAVGFDASDQLLKIASSAYSSYTFKRAFLPELNEVDEKFQNVICETVIMHLNEEQIPHAIENLIRITENQGILYISWRVSETNQRCSKGRLYSAFPNNLIMNFFKESQILYFEDVQSESSKKRVCRLVIKNEV